MTIEEAKNELKKLGWKWSSHYKWLNFTGKPIWRATAYSNHGEICVIVGHKYLHAAIGNLVEFIKATKDKR